MSSEPERGVRTDSLSQRLLRALALGCAAAAAFGAVIDLPQLPSVSRSNAAMGSTVVASMGGDWAPAVEAPQRIDRSAPKAALPLPSTGHILIPAIGVDAPLIPLGLTPDGTLGVPIDWSVTGWFTGGPFPGEPGPAVVVGHVDSTQGPAVFYRLRELQEGDVIVLWRTGQPRSRFRVVSTQRVSKSAFPTQRVYGPVADPVLRLITCDGAFDRSTGHYIDNLIIYAVASM